MLAIAENPWHGGLFWTFITLFGLIVGSFLNVVIFRMPRDQSLMTPGSFCPQCERPIAFYANIPVVSYLLLRGRCLQCKSRIPVEYPIVELLTALLWVAITMHWQHKPYHYENPETLGVLELVKWLLFASILIPVAFIDLRHRIIPDKLSVGGMLLGLGLSLFSHHLGWQSSFLGAFIGFGFFWATALLYEKLKKQEGLGGGDIKLLGCIGAFLGVPGVFTTILIGSTVGTLMGLLLAVLAHLKMQPSKAEVSTQSTSMNGLLQYAIPFGPFLVLGALVHLFFSDYLWFLSTIQI
jgi:leader peptidase (prepilin peptidase)/N-methyltransferase